MVQFLGSLECINECWGLREEIQFLETHRLECIACKERELNSNCSLDAVRSQEDIEDEAEERSRTGSILDNLGFNIQNQ